MLQAARTAAESMAVTPLRLTNAVGTPWRRVCSARSMQARAGSCAMNAKRRKRAAVDRCVQAMDVWKVEPQLCLQAFFGVFCSGMWRGQRFPCALQGIVALGNIDSLAGARMVDFMASQCTAPCPEISASSPNVRARCLETSHDSKYPSLFFQPYRHCDR